MAHYAKLDENNIVLEVLVIDDADETAKGSESGTSDWLTDLFGGTKWVKTSYNTWANTHALGGTPFRKNYACIGYTYDSTRDAFYAPQPYASWTLNDTTCLYDPPIAYLENAHLFKWDEDAYQADNSTGWVLIE
tara:strand:+ start:60 stop:461 length:402 start_codon:yes stop_codon:yes gene_type:complete